MLLFRLPVSPRSDCYINNRNNRNDNAVCLRSKKIGDELHLGIGDPCDRDSC